MEQMDLIEHAATKAILGALLEESRLYASSDDYKALLDFVVRLRNFAPFNAMLLHVQRPGLRFAASRSDWEKRFGRTIAEDARPLLIMRPFGPVALVYAVEQTEGDKLPVDVEICFRATGAINKQDMENYCKLVQRSGITVNLMDWGDGKAGHVRMTCTHEAQKANGRQPAIKAEYQVALNRNHQPAAQFATLAHELGHLFLGHLGKNPVLQIPRREAELDTAQEELEAESVAYLVCRRRGIDVESHKYLRHFVGNEPTPKLDVYHIMRAAGRVEGVLKLGANLLPGNN